MNSTTETKLFTGLCAILPAERTYVYLPHGIHRRVLKKLADVRLLSTSLQWSWEYREVPVSWEVLTASGHRGLAERS